MNNLAMKKIIGVFIFIILSCFGTIDAQDSLLLHKVKFRIVNRDLSNALVDLSKATKINIAFNIIDIPEKKISLYAPNYSLKEVLDFLIKGTKLKYTVLNDQVVVFLPKNESDKENIIYGYITDKKSGEKLVYASVYLPVSRTGTVSNDYGFYSLKLNNNDTTVVFSYLGYKSLTVKLSDLNNANLDVNLEKEPDKILDEIIITETKSGVKKLEFYEPEKINIEGLEKMVHIAGEDDIVRYNYVKPGVLTGADGFGGMHVRGGNTGGNIMLLDGVPVYNAQHAIGLFSVFNSSIIKTAKFLKGDFPARYGGGLESVLDVRTRDGNKKKLGGEFDVGIFTVKGVLEGPISDNKSSILLSFRRTYLDIWSKAFSSVLSNEIRKKKFSYYFYDLNMKLNIELNKRNRLYLNLYKGIDNFLNNSQEFKSKDDDLIVLKNDDIWKWGNRLMSIQLNSQLGQKIFVNTTIYNSKYSLNSNSSNISLLPNESSKYFYGGSLLESEINDIGLKVDVDYAINSYNFLRFGTLNIHHEIEPFVYIKNSIINTIPDAPKPDEIKSGIQFFSSNSVENRFYIEDKMSLGNSSLLNLGIHFAVFNNKDMKYKSIEPRLIFSSFLSKNIVYSASIVKMSQFSHLLTNNGLGLPSEILLPSTKRLLPEEVWQFGTGINYDIKDNMNFSVNAYYKYAKNLVEQKRGSSFIISQNSNWEDYIPGGIGKMYGIETQLKYSVDKFRLLFNYTYSKSKRSYKHILDGKFLDYRFSRTHYMNFLLFYEISKKTILSLSSVYGSGNPYTIPTQLTPEGELIYEEPNNYKLPFYQRIDVGVMTKFNVKGTSQELKIGIYNLLSRKNPFYVTFKGTKGFLYNTDFKQVYVFPIFPSVKYRIKF